MEEHVEIKGSHNWWGTGMRVKMPILNYAVTSSLVTVFFIICAIVIKTIIFCLRV